MHKKEMRIRMISMVFAVSMVFAGICPVFGQSAEITQTAQEEVFLPAGEEPAEPEAEFWMEPVDLLEACLEEAAEEESGSGEIGLEEAGSLLLSGSNLELYRKLLEKTEAVAAGEETYTVFDIDLDVSAYQDMEWTAQDLQIDSLVRQTDDGLETAPEVRTVMQKITGYDGDLVIRTLVNRCTTQLYWFGLGYYCGYPYEVYSDNGTFKVRMTGQVHVILTVSPDYAKTDEETGEVIRYTTDPSKTERVETAVARAKEIAKEAETISGDREKMRFFYEKISDLSGYDYEAASGGHYGDPWQIINVFDDDPETKVVCEGYSKAFQFLCDHTAFESEESRSYCVTGYQTWEGAGSLPASTHMWNIVHLEEGNYLVDVTNGNRQPDLFLASCIKGTLEKGYYIPITTLAGKRVNYLYIYSEDTRQLYEEDALRLAGTEGIWYAVERQNNLEKEAELSVYRTDPQTGEETLLLPEETIEEGQGLRAELYNKGSHFLVLQIYLNNGRLLKEAVVDPGKKGSVLLESPDADLKIQIGTTIKKISGITLKYTALTYNGKARKPAVTVKCGSRILKQGTDYSVSYKKNINVGTASVTVTGKGNYYGSISKSFRIKPKKTEVSAVISGSKRLTVKWKKQTAQADGYQILLSTSKDFSKNRKKVTVSKAAGKKVIKKLKAKTKYYIRMRTYRKADGTIYYSDWSRVKCKKTGK